jgi:hypothetical protein
VCVTVASILAIAFSSLSGHVPFATYFPAVTSLEKQSAGVRMVKPMAHSSISDYLDSLRAPLGRAVDRAQRVVERELTSASKMGYYGNTIQRGLDKLQREFDTGIFVALARLKRARQKASLDHSELWQATVKELENFTRQMKSVMDREGVAALRLAHMTLVHDELAKLDGNLSSALRQFQEGLFDVGESPPLADKAQATAGNPGTPPTVLSGTLAGQAAPAPRDTSTFDITGNQTPALRGAVSNAALSSIDITVPYMSLPDDLKKAFLEAVMRCSEWKFGGTEPEMPFNRQLYKISAVCHFILACKNEPLPDNLADVLARLPDELRADLVEYLGKDWSYHAGARCVIRLVANRNKPHGNLK